MGDNNSLMAVKKSQVGQQNGHAGILPVSALIYVAIVRSAVHFFHTRSQAVTRESGASDLLQDAGVGK